ncbi:DUF418 domain-containing protein [Paenibacillus sp. J5C_2022]|uniref:DUF418 domain-containing protein n=1 Tax=Paenibacillus sp. J5C2022 TaxID=2977129 RepID=UPI0021D152C0|nr:DUF418 domain-containing protein [Paenibacillus sp. J5C2022]MCU6709821.1 DUF418 domain-containing protein [Paenibacillus sp. J5C2022]
MGSNSLNHRLDVLDYLRGFAMIGILFVNVILLLDIGMPEADTPGEMYQKFLYLFVEARFFSIFSFLFGVGFYLFISRANAKGNNGYLLFLIRVGLLFLFGLAHVFFNSGEALMPYAVFGALLLPLYKARREFKLAAGLLITAVCAITGQKLLLVPGFMLLGMAAGEYRVFEDIGRKRKGWAVFTLIMLLLGAAGLYYQYSLAPGQPFSYMVVEGVDDPMVIKASQFIQAGLLVTPVVTGVYIGAFVMLMGSPVFRRLLSPLRDYGRMALTNYIGQTFLVLLAGQLFGYSGSIGLMESLWLVLVIHGLQVTASVVWLRLFAMGPLEWLWRAGTYRKLPQLRKQR